MKENNLADSLVASDDDFDNDGDFDDEEVEAKTNQQTNRKSNAMKSGIFWLFHLAVKFLKRDWEQSTDNRHRGL